MKTRMLLWWLPVVMMALLAVDAWLLGREMTSPVTEKTFVMHPIGVVQKSNDRVRIVLEEKYVPGLLGLDGFSHIQVLWWFDQNDTPEKRAILQVHPRGDMSNPLTGVFATRSPFRPNLIALTTCKIVGIEGNVIDVENVDAFDGTPVLDIKPYLPGLDSESDIRLPAWVKPKPRCRGAQKACPVPVWPAGLRSLYYISIAPIHANLNERAIQLGELGGIAVNEDWECVWRVPQGGLELEIARTPISGSSRQRREIC